MRLALVAVAALLIAPAATAHIPFKDGSGSAKVLQRTLNRSPDFSEIRCRYCAPHVNCRGYGRLKRTDAFLVVTVVVHKTAPNKGYAFICMERLGICKKQLLTFSR